MPQRAPQCTLIIHVFLLKFHKGNPPYIGWVGGRSGLRRGTAKVPARFLLRVIEALFSPLLLLPPSSVPAPHAPVKQGRAGLWKEGSVGMQTRTRADAAGSSACVRSRTSARKHSMNIS